MGIYLLSTACYKSYVEFQKKSLKDRYISVPVKKLAKFASVFLATQKSRIATLKKAPSQPSLTNSAEDTREKSAKLRG